MNYCSVYVTCANETEAETIGTALVKAKLAACANIIPSIKSIYEWEAKIQHDSESVLLLKTRTDLFDQIVDKIALLHSYAIPGIIKIPWLDAKIEFQQWMQSQLVEPTQHPN